MSLNMEKSAVAYTLCRSKRRRRSVALSIEPDGGVRVLAPMRLSLKEIDSFVQGRSDWIYRKFKVLQQTYAVRKACDFTTGLTIHYLGEAYRLCVKLGESQRSLCRIEGQEIIVWLPDAGLSPSAQHEETRLELLLWYKKQARREFRERLDLWAARLGVAYGKAIVTNPDKRWGSCNARGDIRLNWRLIMMPPTLIDYVVAHELCHIRHKNHGAAFWRFLGTVMPDYKARRKALRERENVGW